MTVDHAPPLVVVDTDVVSIIHNKDRDERAPYYETALAGRRLLVSFQTLEELLFGARSGGWGQRRINELLRHLERYEVVWPDDEMVELSAIIRDERRARGRALDTADAWVAATALTLGCPLASHDRDFSDIPGLEVIRAPR